MEDFAKDLRVGLTLELGYGNISVRVSGNKNTIFLKFPILKDIGLSENSVPEDIFVRCDFSLDLVGNFSLVKNLITAGDRAFFVNSYDLPTMFSNKIVAFLERNFYKGKFQNVPFKGRDVFDLFWFLNLSAKSSYRLLPNIGRLKSLLGEPDVLVIKNRLLEKNKCS